MKFHEPVVGYIRILTRKLPWIYKGLGKLYHGFLYRKERLYFHRKYPAVLSIRYDEATLRSVENKGFHSQYGQDYFLMENGLVPESSGTFIDIGCNDPVNTSNSCYLEHRCGFEGIAIDPLGNFREDWAKDRPNTLFVNSFVSDSDENLDFLEVSGESGWEDMLSGAADSVRLSGKHVTTTSTKIKPRRLRDILLENQWEFGVDVMFIDVEGHELNVLKSADWSQKKPGVIVIENTGPLQTQEELRKFISEKGYTFFARIDIADDIWVSDLISP
jgi:FkbM family methyltransferase